MTLVLKDTEHNSEHNNNGRPPLHFKPRFSLALAANEDDEQEEDENTQQGTNRRRHTLSTATVGVGVGIGTAATASTANNMNNNNANNNKHYAWDDFVRQGTRLKTFLDDAMNHVKTNIHIGTNSNSNSKRPRELTVNGKDDPNHKDDDNNNSDDDDDDSPRPLRRRRVEENDYTAELAREKTEQVMLLQRVSEWCECQCESEINGRLLCAPTCNCTEPSVL